MASEASDGPVGAGPGSRPGDRGERGSSLMLMPAAVLVVIILGAIAVDLSAIYLGQRDLVAGAQAAANDAAAYGIDQDVFYRSSGGEIRYDEGRVRTAVNRAIAARDISPTSGPSISYETTPDGLRVVVSFTDDVPYIFAKAIPGTPSTSSVRAEASALLRQEE